MRKIAPGITMLELSAAPMGQPTVIHPTLLSDEETVLLVDSGLPGQQADFRQAIEKAGLSFEKLTKIILTHHDIDHVGSLATILEELPGCAVLAHQEEQPFIQGERTPVKVAQLEAQLNSLPEPMKFVYEKLKAGFAQCRVPVHQTLADGEILPFGGGITIIATPGHTPGHICLYHQRSKTLIAGDALTVEGDTLIPTSASHHWNSDLAVQSLQKLTQFDIAAVICYHGGLYTTDVNRRIAELAEGD